MRKLNRILSSSSLTLGVLAIVGALAIVTLRLRDATRPALVSITSGLAIPSRSHLIWVFRPEDCGGSQAVVDLLNTGYAHGRAVSGILGVDDESRVDRVRKAYGVTIPVSRTTTEMIRRLSQDLGYQKTPFVMLLDAEGKVREVAPGPQAIALVSRWLEVGE